MSSQGTRATHGGRFARITPVVVALTLLGGPVLGQATGYAGVPAATEGVWELTDPLSVPRYDHTTTLLANGKVLAAGGRRVDNSANFNSAEIYDPITEEWQPTGSMNVYRWRHTATLLPDGRVLVTGGFNGTAVGSGANAQAVLDSAEIYDPATGTWTPTGSMNTRRALHVAVLLPNGKVLVAGGRTCNLPPPATCPGAVRTNTAELYDPATGTFTPTGSMNEQRHTTAIVLLQNGTVLVPAGFSNIGPQGNSRTGDVYNPATGTWSLTGQLNFARARQGAMLLHDGRVLVALGFAGMQTTEIYNPATNTWSLADPLEGFVSRFNFSYAVLPNGKALVAGGQTFPPSLVVRNSDIYDPATNQWSPGGLMNVPHGSGSSLANSDPAVVLSASPTSYVADPAVCGRHCGKVMVAGNAAGGETELYTAAGTCFGFNATITGTPGNDTLSGTRGPDVILTLGGHDRISAGGGHDIVCAGDGNDQISGDVGNDIVLGGQGFDMAAGVDGNDFLFGEASGDTLDGGNGADTTDGGADIDRCSGETVRKCP